MPPLYPIFLNLQSRTCLVVGAGRVGTRKASGLVDAGALVRMVAPVVCPEAEELAQNKLVSLVRAPYIVEHLASVMIVFAATNDSTINARVVADARDRNIPANSADAPEDGDFIVPATLRRGALSIAISTGGASPGLARQIKARLEPQFDEVYAAYVELLSAMRDYIKQRSKDKLRKLAAFETLLEADTELRQILALQGEAVAFEAAQHIVDSVLAESVE